MSQLVHEPLCFDSFQDLLNFEEEFDGKQIKDEWRSAGSAGGTSIVSDAWRGGVVILITDGDNGDHWRIDWGDIRSLHVDQRVCIEARVKLEAATFISLEIALFFDWQNYIEFHFNEAAGAAINWFIDTTDGGVSTYLTSGIAIDTDWHIYRMEVHTFGGNHVHYYIDGVQTANSPISTNVPDDAADFLQPYFRLVTREGATKSCEIDYIVIKQDRG